MPTLAEQVAAVTAVSAKLDSLLTATPVETTVELTTAEAVAHISAELAKGGLLEPRAKYLSTVLADVAKVNSEGTNTSIQIKVVNDPLQIKPNTESIATIQTLSTLKPDSHFASNLHSVIGKAELIQKLLLDRAAIAKGKVSDKYEEIVKLFGFTEDDLKSECELRWKISDLIGQLQTAARLESLVEKSETPVKDAPTETTPTGSPVWPDDMAQAKFDPVAKSYTKPELPWGYDQTSQR